MKKKVNITPRRAILFTNPPIRVPIKNVYKEVNEIYSIIKADAIVDEVLSDGSTVRLNIMNYDKDNSVKVNKQEEKPVVVKPEVKETPKVEVEEKPIVEETVDVIKEDVIPTENTVVVEEQPIEIKEEKESSDNELESIDIDDLINSSNTEEIEQDQPRLTKKQRKALRQKEAASQTSNSNS